MIVTNNIEEAVCHAILLHKQLRDNVIWRKLLFFENRLDDMSEVIVKGEQIEEEIEKIHKTIFSLLTSTNERNEIVGQNRNYLNNLLDTIKTTIKDTKDIVDHAENELQKMKRQTADDIRELDTRKKAINSYNRIAATSYYRGIRS